MRKIRVLFCFILIGTFPLFASDQAVRIYSELRQENWGRAGNRDRIYQVEYMKFMDTSSLPAPDEGFTTAVLFEGGLADLLYGKMEPGMSAAEGASSISLVDYNGERAYRLRQDDWGVDVVFTLEESPKEIFTEIEAFYHSDSYNRELVIQEYRENPVIRILRANDVLEPDGQLSFREAMVAATLIGKSFQPFFGIHDGLNMLGNIGYLLVEKRIEPEMRPLLHEERPEGEYADYVFRVENMEGAFAENAYVLARTLCRLREGSDEYATQEQFLGRDWGGSRDFALLFFRILAEHDYDVKLLRINAGSELPNEYMVVYRAPAGRMWGFMGAEYWTGERFGNWTRIPALYKGRTVQYQELDGGAILREERWTFPGSGRWLDSYY